MDATSGSKYFGKKEAKKPKVYSLSGKALEKSRFEDLRHGKTKKQAKDIKRRRHVNKIARNSRRVNR